MASPPTPVNFAASCRRALNHFPSSAPFSSHQTRRRPLICARPVPPGNMPSRIIGAAGWSISKSGRGPTNDISPVKIFQSRGVSSTRCVAMLQIGKPGDFPRRVLGPREIRISRYCARSLRRRKPRHPPICAVARPSKFFAFRSRNGKAMRLRILDERRVLRPEPAPARPAQIEAAAALRHVPLQAIVSNLSMKSAP